MQEKVELLSPAGNLHKLKIALNFGADAVYGGISHFSLRNRSGREFDDDTFMQGIRYAHTLGKKVYATVNGFPFNSQIGLYEKHIAKMADFGVDALIVATPGVVRLAKKVAPRIPLHLSTQANVMNRIDAEVYSDMGVTRIIAAREVSLKDLEEIKKHLPHMEIEVFIHGSMCFAYSGRCLISTLQTGRIPNRGSCANDCRFPYEVYVKNSDSAQLLKIVEEGEEGSYIFNAKDLNMSAHIDEILKSGIIDSLKIEGRTKSDYYAAVTARTYREAIDDYYRGKYDPQKYESELNTLKNRGYNDGYLVKRPYEKNDTQELSFAQSEGDFDVCGEVREDGVSFLCKHTTIPNTEYELIAPKPLAPYKDDLGEIYAKEGRYYITFYKILTANDKELESVHSGNTNPIKLPGKLPEFTFFRRRTK